MNRFIHINKDHYVTILLSRTKDEIYKARKAELDRHNINIAESAVLFAIMAIGEKATPTEISRLLARKPHTISELVSRMEKEKLVRRVEYRNNKSRVRVALTKKGREVYYQASKQGYFHEIMSCLSDKERQQLISYLIKLKDRAQAINDRESKELRSKYEMTSHFQND